MSRFRPSRGFVPPGFVPPRPVPRGQAAPPGHWREIRFRRRSDAEILPHPENQRGVNQTDEGENVPVTGPTGVGTGQAEDARVELSRLIDTINERFGTEFNQADELFFHQLREEALSNEELQQAAKANTLENFRYVFVKALEGLFTDRMEQNEDIFAKYMNDADFKKVISEHLLRQVYEQIRQEAG